MKKFIAFFEIPTVDFHRAVDFYETVFGVQLPVFECEEEKMACFTEEGETELFFMLPIIFLRKKE